MIRFICPLCNASVKAKPSLADQRRTCPGCQNTIRVPLKSGPVQPWAFKGDQLGMSLADFRAKYHRTVEGDDRCAPFCSDGSRNVYLLSEPWMAEAGIVHCSTYFPFERDGDRTPTTVAGVPTECVVYKFIDEQLFQVFLAFATDFFGDVLAALEAKYGEADDSERNRHFMWTNYVSMINLQRGKIRPAEASILTFSHIKLGARAIDREPGPAIDDL